jgi:hypothetical protein
MKLIGTMNEIRFISGITIRRNLIQVEKEYNFTNKKGKKRKEVEHYLRETSCCFAYIF